jgi:hypothetical protein
LAPGSRLRADCFTDHDRGKTLAAKVAAAGDGAIGSEVIPLIVILAIVPYSSRYQMVRHQKT